MKKYQHIATMKAVLLASCGVIASAAHAQDGNVEAVTVTGTHISRPGFEAPTPVTAVSATDVEKVAPTTISDLLNTLPQFGTGDTAHGGFSGGSGGASFLNLRDLGADRTLVLLNGERVVSSTLTGTVDMNLLPTALLQRVDVVTGGASAAYGSDAVAGVVNLVLDTNFTGFKANAQYGNNYQQAYEGFSGNIAGGMGFDNDRGHIVASVSYFNNPQFYQLGQAQWNTKSMLMPNPAYTPTNGQPKWAPYKNVGMSQSTEGGVILSGPLANTQFVGPNATPAVFYPGIVGGVMSANGSGETSLRDRVPLAQPQRGTNFFTNIKYRLTDDISAHVSLDYGQDSGATSSGAYQRNGNVLIHGDNPFIPAQTKAEMTRLGITSFNLGVNEPQLGNPKTNSLSYYSNRSQLRTGVGFDGDIDGWAWSAYYGHGETHFKETWVGAVYVDYFNLATDAVLAPVGNAAGIVPNTIVCRSTLTNPDNGCAPLNVFGIGNASNAAKSYVTPPQWTQINNKQDVVSLSIEGEPFSDWAGPVSLAGGGSYRSESAVSYSNPLAYTQGYQAGNSLPFRGAVNVYEAYIETVVPLVKGQAWAQSMEFNGAGRITDYSTSGVVETWKLGISNQVNDEVRLRATWSNDIRAPNLAELFTVGTSGGRPIPDPFNGGHTSQVLATSTGNLNLKPEVATTYSGGVVYTPEWLPNFTASVDWYSITLKGAISTTSAENELAYCYAGRQVYCPLIHRNSSGVITQIFSSPANTDLETTSGLDVEIAYSHDLWDGLLDLRALANYTDQSTTNQNGIIIDNAGSLNPDIGGDGQPKFKGTVTASYSKGPYSLTAQTRLIGTGHLNNRYTSADVADNSVPFVGYLDLRGSYTLDSSIGGEFYFAVDNVLNTPPPNIMEPYSAPSVYLYLGAPGNIYDLLGRQYRTGVRVRL